MKKSKTCMMPRCDKDVYKSKGYFCIDHQRDFLTFRKTVGTGAVTLLSVALLFIAKTLSDKEL